MSRETTELTHNQNISTGISGEYIFDNGLPEAVNRFGLLSKLFDGRTIHYIEQRGIREGWSCLEVGGGGSIAAFLCTRTGDAGRVLATDIDPRFLQGLAFPNLGVRRHDIRSQPLPEQEFDLVHARLVLEHLAEPEAALKRMVAALKPGGWIILEEFDHLGLLPNPEDNSPDELLKLREAFQQVLAARGVEMHYGRLLARRLSANGLVNVGAEVNGSVWKSGSAGITLLKLNCEGLRVTIIGSGLMSESEFDSDMKRLDEPDFSIASPVMWTAWGQLGGG
jgi:SAM-dependent methyltransferase